MIKRIFFSLTAFVLILSVGCQKDTDEFIKSNNSTSITSNIFGIVLDENNSPISEVEVTFAGMTTYSDDYGIYRFKGVPIDSRHNFLTINKDGYFETARTFRSSKSTSITLKTILAKEEFLHSFPSSSGGRVIADQVVIDFPSNGFVIHQSSTPYNGNVNVAVKYLNPLEEDLINRMPGDLTGVNNNDLISTLQSFGMVAVEMKSDNGEKLQLAKGHEAIMTVRIPNQILEFANSSIPMWHFDMNTGLWVEESVAELLGSEYQAKVAHFSWWNYDESLPSIVLNGRILDQNGKPIPDIHVWISETGKYLGGHGDTHQDGTFSGQAPKDLVLDLKVYGLGECFDYSTPIFITQIGPFSQDTDIGDITVFIPQDEIMSVTGTFLDCNDQLITNGFASIDNRFYFDIIDGTLDVSIPVCNTEIKSLVVTNIEELKSTSPISLQSPGVNTLGTRSACEEDSDYVRIVCDQLGINEYILNMNPDSINNGNNIGIQFFNQNTDTKLFFAYQGQKAWFNASYSDAVNDVYGEGTFDLELGENGFEGVEYLNHVSGSITITKGGNPGDQIIGTFEFIGSDGSDEYSFMGDFKLTN